jgi:hypothetical protein
MRAPPQPKLWRGALRSEPLGLLLRREEGGRLALFDGRTGARLQPDG